MPQVMACVQDGWVSGLAYPYDTSVVLEARRQVSGARYEVEAHLVYDDEGIEPDKLYAQLLYYDGINAAVQIGQWLNGVAGLGEAAPQDIKLRTLGSSIQVYRNGTSIMTVTHTGISVAGIWNISADQTGFLSEDVVPFVFADDFSRANGVVGNGWTASYLYVNNGLGGPSSTAAYTSAEGARALPAGADKKIQADVRELSASASNQAYLGLKVAVSNAWSSMYLLVMTEASFILKRYSAGGVATTIDTKTAYKLSTTAKTVRMWADASGVKVSVNGTTIIDVPDTTFPASTLIAAYFGGYVYTPANTGAYIDNFVIFGTAAAPAGTNMKVYTAAGWKTVATVWVYTAAGWKQVAAGTKIYTAAGWKTVF